MAHFITHYIGDDGEHIVTNFEIESVTQSVDRDRGEFSFWREGIRPPASVTTTIQGFPKKTMYTGCDTFDATLGNMVQNLTKRAIEAEASVAPVDQARREGLEEGYSAAIQDLVDREALRTGNQGIEYTPSGTLLDDIFDDDNDCTCGAIHE